MIRPSLLFLLCFSLMLLAGVSHAETTAERIFGAWEKVTPETILRPVAILTGSASATGSVTRYAKADSLGCAIYEQNKVIGWSMSCKFPSVDRGGIRELP